MAVYVDDARLPFGRMIMCHMWADSLEELLHMADTIGVARRWIQGHPTLSLPQARKASWIHFDISLGKKKLALQYGAILTDRYGPLEHTSRLRLASSDPEVVKRALDKLRAIENIRGRKREDNLQYSGTDS